MWFTLPLKYIPSHQTGANRTQSFVLDEDTQLDIGHGSHSGKLRLDNIKPLPSIAREGDARAPAMLPLSRIDSETGSAGSGGGLRSDSQPQTQRSSLFTRLSIAQSTPRDLLNVVLSQHQQRVLIVDDSMAILKMMKRTLK